MKRWLLGVLVSLAMISGAQAQSINQIKPSTSTASLTATASDCSASPSASVAVLYTQGFASVSAAVSGTFVGYTINWKSTLDGTNWYPLLLSNASGTLANTATATGLYTGSVNALAICGYVSARTSGTAVVALRTTLSPSGAATFTSTGVTGVTLFSNGVILGGGPGWTTAATTLPAGYTIGMPYGTYMSWRTSGDGAWGGAFIGVSSQIMELSGPSNGIRMNSLSNFTAGIQNNGFLMVSQTAPTISGGTFGTSPSIPTSNGSAAFTVNVGTGGVASTGVVVMPTANSGWSCCIQNLSSPDSFITSQTASTNTSVSVKNYSRLTGMAIAWNAGDVLSFNCSGR